MMAKGTRVFKANNGTWGDPKPGLVKTLVIVYKYKGEEHRLTAKEHTNERITLPSNEVVKGNL